MRRTLDLNNDRVVFRRVRGRIVPVRVGAWERTKSGLTGSLAPAAVAAVLGEGIAVAMQARKAKAAVFSLRNAAHFGKLSTLKSLGKVAALTVGFSIGYNLLFGARQRNVVALDKPIKERSKARIWLASKPGLTPGHDVGEHSFLHLRDRFGRTTVYGGQIKDVKKYGQKGGGVGLVKNFKDDKISRATNVHDLTLDSAKATNRKIALIHRHAERLGYQLKKKDYQYRMIPIGAGTVNSNSVTGTLVRRSKLGFRYNARQHNMPGFERSIPKE